MKTNQISDQIKTINSTDLRLLNAKGVEDIVYGYLSPGVNIIAGDPKSFKTTASLQLAENLSQSGKNCLMIAPDEGFLGLHQKLIQMDIQDGGKIIFWDIVNNPVTSIDMVEDYVRSRSNIDVVIIDTVHATFPGEFGGGYIKQNAKMKLFTEMTNKYGTSFILTMHCKKDKKTKPDKPDFQSIYGTHALNGSAVNTILMGKDLNSQMVYVHRQGRFCKYSRRTLIYNAETFRLKEYTPNPVELLDGNLKAVYSAMSLHAVPMRLSDIAHAVEKETNHVSNLLDTIIKRRLVHRISHGMYEIIPAPSTAVDGIVFKQNRVFQHVDPIGDENEEGLQAEIHDDNVTAIDVSCDNPNHSDEIDESATESVFCEFWQLDKQSPKRYETDALGEIVNLGEDYEESIFQHGAGEWYYCEE